MPVLPVPLCQFRFYQHFITYDCVAGFFMPGCDGASATDSGRSGTRISTLLIVFLYLFDVQRVINQILLLFLVTDIYPTAGEAEAGRPA